MRNAAPIVSLVLSSLCAMASAAAAQQALELPQPSPHARVEQRVGLTDLSLDYSSPGVKGRKIWGEVVPYDKAWRAGANAPTKLTASRDFTFGGTAVPAGTYNVFMTPGKAAWTVMLNKNLTATQDQHDAKDDVATLTIKPLALPATRERLRYTFDDTKDDATTLTLEWERVRLAVAITVDTKGQVAGNVDRATGDLWRIPFNAASYLFDHDQADKALELVDRSIAIQKTWRGEWLRAQIQHKKGNKAEATASLGRAQDLGKGDQAFEAGKPAMQKTIASWK